MTRLKVRAYQLIPLKMKLKQLLRHTTGSHCTPELHAPERQGHVTSLDCEVLAFDARRTYWGEDDISWEWESIERRGSRKPSLDDYDRWSGCKFDFGTSDGIRRNHC